MKLKFKNINPNLLLDKISETDIKNVRVTSTPSEEKIRETVWVECLTEDAETIKSLAENLDNIEEKIQLSEEERIKNLEGAIEDLANMISSIAEGSIQ